MPRPKKTFGTMVVGVALAVLATVAEARVPARHAPAPSARLETTGSIGMRPTTARRASTTRARTARALIRIEPAPARVVVERPVVLDPAPRPFDETARPSEPDMPVSPVAAATMPVAAPATATGPEPVTSPRTLEIRTAAVDDAHWCEDGELHGGFCVLRPSPPGNGFAQQRR